MSSAWIWVPVGAWTAGLVSWIVTAASQYAGQAERVERQRQRLEGACEKDPSYAKELGDLKKVAEQRAGGAASAEKAFCANYSQPLLVALITSLGAFLSSSPSNIAGPLVAWVAMIGIALGVAIVDSKVVEDGWLRKIPVVILIWILALLVFTYLGFASSESKDKNDQKGVSSAPAHS